MQVDWRVVASIASPIIGLFVGIFVNRWLGDRPRLVVYYGHVSSFQIAPAAPGGPSTQVNTHSIVIANNGRRAAREVRVSHAYMPPNIRVFPDLAYRLDKLPGGGEAIIFPAIVPKQNVTISYAYFPPLTFNQISTHVASDEGFAKVLSVVLMEPTPRWLRNVTFVLAIWGLITLVYLFRSGWHRLVS